MLNLSKKDKELRNRAKYMLDEMPKNLVEEVIDFIEFVKEKKEAQQQMSKILSDMHKTTEKKGMKRISAEDVAEFIHKKRGVR